MAEIRFLAIEQVLAIHEDSIRRYGGDSGLRDRGLLESALATPQMTFGGSLLHTDLYSMAAAYLFHICSNHPFIDGNKRTAAATAAVFLEVNGYELTASEPELVDLVLAVAQGNLQKPEIAQFFRDHSQPVV